MLMRNTRRLLVFGNGDCDCFSSGETERGVVKVCWDHQGLLLLFSSLYCYLLVQADIERERKGRAGVENLAKALQVLSIIFILTGLSVYDWHHHHHQETPKFGGEESQADVQDKLQHMRSMMTYLEASRSMMTLMMMMMTYLETSFVAAAEACGDHSHQKLSLPTFPPGTRP